MSTEKNASAGEPTAEVFLDILQKKDVLPGSTLAALRKQVAESKTRIPARHVAKLLIDKGLLTAAMAQHLLGGETKPPAKPAPAGPTGRAAAAAPTVAPQAGKKPSSPAAAPGKGQPPKPAPHTPPAAAAPPAASGLSSLLDEEFPSLSDDLPSLGAGPLDALMSDPRSAVAPAAPGKGQPPKPAVRTPPAAAALPVDGGMSSLLDEELSTLSGGLPSLGAGPLDALMGDPSLAEAVQETSPLDAPAPAKESPLAPSAGAGWGSRRRAQRRLWIWLGAAAAGVLAIIVTIIWVATRQDPTKLLQPADAAYQQGAYAEAIKKYDAFLARFPRLAVSGRVRVRRGLARLQLALAESNDESAALEAARTVLPEISPEAEFDAEAGPVLATLLPPVAEASASYVQRHPTSIAHSEEMLALAQQYIPAADKPRERLGKVEAILALLRQRDAGDEELKRATAAIQQAVEAKDLKEAYRVRTALLNAYPQFSKYDALAEAVAKIATAEQAAVAWVATPQAAGKEPAVEKEPAVATLSTVIVAQRKFTASPPEAEGHVIFAAAAGAVYGLEAGSGKVLWRTFVGFNPDGRDEGCTPTAIAPQADSDVVMAAASHREVQRVEAATGRVKWRYAVAEGLCGEPVVADDQVLAATRSGRLVVIDAAKGNSAGFVQFPQALGGAAAVDPSRKLVFQAADSDNLFVLAMRDKRCCQVFPLGHGPGSIVAPPVVFGDYLLLAVNDAAGGSSLQVLEIHSVEPRSSAPPLQWVQTIPLKGHVDVGPSIAGQRLLLTTDHGDVHLLERSAAGAKLPLREVTGIQLDGGAGLVRFPLLQAGTCLVGDVHLASFEIQPGNNKLLPAWRDKSEGALCQTPMAIGLTVFSMRHMGDLPGVVVSAVSADKGEPYWQTCLAAPLVGEPTVSSDGRKVTAVTALGGVFELPVRASTGLAAVDQPAAAPLSGPPRPVTCVVRCGTKLALVVPPSGAIPPEGGTTSADQVLAFGPADPQKPLASWVLPASLACSPIAFADGLLSPLGVGQIYLLDPLSGKGLITPFQPRLQPGALPSWRGPVVVGDKQVVISDGRNRLYRLQLVTEPESHLDVVAKVELAEPIVSSLATTGKAVCGVDVAGKLDFFLLPDLAHPSQQHALAGRCVWGPCRIGNRVMLATDAGTCYCFDESGQLVWQAALPYGPLAGAPLAVKDYYLLAAASGVVWRAEAASGKELRKVDVGCPLATGPVLLGNRLLIGGHDGSLYQIAAP